MTIQAIQTKTYEEIMQFIQNIANGEQRDILIDNQFLMSYDERNTRADITIYNGPDYEKSFSTKAANFEHFTRGDFERLLDTAFLKFLGITKDFEIYVGPFSQNNFELRNVPVPVTINDLLNLIDQKAYRSSDLDIFISKKGEVSITV